MLKQVVFSIEGSSLLDELSRKHECKVDLVDCRSSNQHAVSLLVEVKGEHSGELIEELKHSPKVRRVYSAASDPDKTLVMIMLDMSPYCSAARESGAFCVNCPLGSENLSDAGWKLLVNDASGLKKVSDALAKHGIDSPIRELSSAFHDEILTERQREIVDYAYKCGYFEFPRKNDLTEIASEMSIRPSTMSEILRRAESKIVKHYMQSFRTDERSS